MDEDSIILIGKIILGIVIGVLVMFGIVFFMTIDNYPLKVKYYENNIEIPAIEYHNEIYLKKGE